MARSCKLRDFLIVELVEGSYDALPALVSVTAEALDEPTTVSTPCSTDLEIKHISTTPIVHQEVRVTLDVSE